MANRSTFPEKIDSFVELYDLPPSKVAKAKRLQDLKQKPTLNATEQDELNNLVVELGNYIITPETWNKFADSLVNVETFFTQEVMGYIEAKQKLWDSYVKAFTYKGVYNAETQYRYQNMITYNGDLYLCTRDAKGIVPTNTTYWQKISAKGDKGDVGLNTYYKGAYDPTKTYAVGDAVDYQGNLYYAKVATSAGQSPTNSNAWYMFVPSVVTGSTAPNNPQQGLIWIQEV